MKFSNYTFFLMQDGTVRCCGLNTNGQLGLGNTTNQTTVRNFPFTGVKKIVCGVNHTFIILKDGSVKAYGRNQLGELGLGYATAPSPYSELNPVNILINKVVDIVCGTNYTFFIMEDGSIKCCGRNNYGQLGLGYTGTNQIPLVDLPLTGVKDIITNYDSTLFLMEDGTVKVCGRNQYGQLGLGHTSSQTTVATLPLQGVKNIVCGAYHTFFLMQDGTIKCCGQNTYGQLGLGNTTSRNSPVNSPVSGVKKIKCGERHNFFFMEDGSIKCCGNNQYGQLGLGNTANQTSAVIIPISGVRDIECGANHTFFLMQDGTVKCCGYNQYGQLGLGYATSTSPYAVSTPTDLPFSGVVGFAQIKSKENFTVKYLLNEINDKLTVYDSDLLKIKDTLSEDAFRKYGFNRLADLNKSINKIVEPMDFDRVEGEGKLYKKLINTRDFIKLYIE